ncbi:MAG: aminotransferase class I/II-fold pyridoxal phosphate-dependent enzyme [Bacteroidales bacterium]|nr:aminotransferase class I/II-fold pyridoxal phosphate-dependent enzyme [Bacteroidales bacterium]
MVDLFEKYKSSVGPLEIHRERGQGYYIFPKLEGEISNYMTFKGKRKLVWSINNYLGLANHPEVRKADAEAAVQFGMAYPMGARAMSGQTAYHEQLEHELADFAQKEAAYLLNFGYQGMVSIIETLVDRHDVIVYDSEAHACIIDGMRLHFGKRFVYPHNDIENLEKQLERATRIVKGTGGGILVITEGVYGMAGDLGNLKAIVNLKNKYEFRMLVDDAHGFGTMGKTGRGTGEEYGVQDGVDIYFCTFAKAMAGIGGFVASSKEVVSHLMYNMRSQIFAKSLPMPMVIGAMKRLELLKNQPGLRENLWKIANALQSGMRERGFNLGRTQSPVTPVFLQGGLQQASWITWDLRENYDIFCSIVIYPVVPKDVIMLRIIPTAIHTLDNVDYTINAFTEIRKKLDADAYPAGFAEIPK